MNKKNKPRTDFSVDCNRKKTGRQKIAKKLMQAENWNFSFYRLQQQNEIKNIQFYDGVKKVCIILYITLKNKSVHNQENDAYFFVL